MKLYLPMVMAGGLEMREEPQRIYRTLQQAKEEFIDGEWQACAWDNEREIAWCPAEDKIAWCARIIEVELQGDA